MSWTEALQKFGLALFYGHICHCHIWCLTLPFSKKWDNQSKLCNIRLLFVERTFEGKNWDYMCLRSNILKYRHIVEHCAPEISTWARLPSAIKGPQITHILVTSSGIPHVQRKLIIMEYPPQGTGKNTGPFNLIFRKQLKKTTFDWFSFIFSSSNWNFKIVIIYGFLKLIYLYHYYFFNNSFIYIVSCLEFHMAEKQLVNILNK